MAKIDIIELLRNNVVTFKYTKMDGTIREARGTNARAYFDDNCVTFRGVPSTTGKINYWDIDSEGFRCFDESNVIEIVNSTPYVSKDVE